MRLTHWQYLAGLDQLTSPCLTLSYVSRTGVCLSCGHDPNRDYTMRFTLASLPETQADERTYRATHRKPKAKRGRPVPRVTRALLGS